MSTIYINGQEVDKGDYIFKCKNRIFVSQQEVELLKKADTFINEAIEEHFKSVYKPLDKALEKYGSLEGLHELYGYGSITKAKYDKYCALAEEREELQKLIQDLSISRKVRTEIQKELEIIRQYQARIDEANKDE